MPSRNALWSALVWSSFFSLCLLGAGWTCLRLADRPSAPPPVAAAPASVSTEQTVEVEEPEVEDPADGFGCRATGGNQEVRVSSVSQLASALGQSGSKIVLAPGDYDCDYDQLAIKSNVFFDGSGATLYSPGSNQSGKGVNTWGTNLILRNLHVRNSCDNLGSSSFKRTKDFLIEHVSGLVSGDDDFSPAYNSQDVTIRWSLAAGCSRGCFFKYGSANLTIHHSIWDRRWTLSATGPGKWVSDALLWQLGELRQLRGLLRSN